MSDFDFTDGFIEADETQSQTVKTITDNFKLDPAFKIGIVGVGQCGNNLAQAFHRIGYRRVLLVNTAQTDLDAIEDQIAKLPIDKQGAGKDPAVGKERVESRATQIRNGMLREFGEDFEKVIVCIGLGGGTGSGGGPAVVKIAQEIVKARGGYTSKDVITIVTLPDPNIDVRDNVSTPSKPTSRLSLSAFRVTQLKDKFERGKKFDQQYSSLNAFLASEAS